MKAKKLNNFKKDKTVKVLSYKKTRKIQGGHELEPHIDSWTHHPRKYEASLPQS